MFHLRPSKEGSLFRRGNKMSLGSFAMGISLL